LSDRLASLYAQERQFGVLSTILTGLAIGLAALGLAGLSAFVARRRRKEIGIRKALGATLSSLVVLLNREIVLLVGVALVLATPVAWWAAHAWLQSFATRIDVSPLVFVGVGTAALVLVLLATSVQTLRAARVDPAHVLRSE
jgi:putative ABC transport system permease protein